MKELNLTATRNNGLFSNIFELINLLYNVEYENIYAENINVYNFSLNYSLDNLSSFNDFFKSDINNAIKSININQFYSKRIDTGFDYKGIGTSDIYMNSDKRCVCNYLINKYINLNDSIIREIDVFKDVVFKNNKILGNDC